jgi:hypothetical protein
MTITTKREVTTTWATAGAGTASLELKSFVTWNYQVAPLIIMLSGLETSNQLNLQVNTAAPGATAVWLNQAGYSWDTFIQITGTGSGGIISAYTRITGAESYFLDRYAITSCNPELRLFYTESGSAHANDIAVTVISPGTV